MFLCSMYIFSIEDCGGGGGDRPCQPRMCCEVINYRKSAHHSRQLSALRIHGYEYMSHCFTEQRTILPSMMPSMPSVTQHSRKNRAEFETHRRRRSSVVVSPLQLLAVPCVRLNVHTYYSHRCHRIECRNTKLQIESSNLTRHTNTHRSAHIYDSGKNSNRHDRKK